MLLCFISLKLLKWEEWPETSLRMFRFTSKIMCRANVSLANSQFKYSIDLWSCEWFYGGIDWRLHFRYDLQLNDLLLIFPKEICRLGLPIEELHHLSNQWLRSNFCKDLFRIKEIDDLDADLRVSTRLNRQGVLSWMVPNDAQGPLLPVYNLSLLLWIDYHSTWA